MASQFGCCGYWKECRKEKKCFYLKDKGHFSNLEEAQAFAKECKHFPGGFQIPKEDAITTDKLGEVLTDALNKAIKEDQKKAKKKKQEKPVETKTRKKRKSKKRWQKGEDAFKDFQSDLSEFKKVVENISWLPGEDAITEAMVKIESGLLKLKEGHRLVKQQAKSRKKERQLERNKLVKEKKQKRNKNKLIKLKMQEKEDDTFDISQLKFRLF